MSVRITIADVRIGWSEEELKREKGPALIRFKNPSPFFYAIRPADSLPDLFDKVLADAGTEKIEMLSIYAHGYAELDPAGNPHGGYGLQIGARDIKPGNAASLFARFKGHFANPTLGIELVGCEVAVRSSVKTAAGVAVGDGVALCRTIAEAAGTCVRASSDKQKFDTVATFDKVVANPAAPLGKDSQSGTVMDPGPWEGNTWIICPKGSHKG